jgi:hypothetical protein
MAPEIVPTTILLELGDHEQLTELRKHGALIFAEPVHNSIRPVHGFL